MNIAAWLLLLALGTVDLDVISVPVSNEIKVALTPGARSEIRREDGTTRIRIEVDRLAAPSTLGPAFNTYVVWAVSPEGILDNVGELEIKGTKAQFSATTRLSQFGILITAEPHYMVDRPSALVVFRSQMPETDFRRKRVPIEVGAYDYSKIKPPSGAVANNYVTQARTAFQIAQAANADRLATSEYRNAQVALGAMEELVNRVAPIDILWPAANEAIGWSQRAAATARANK